MAGGKASRGTLASYAYSGGGVGGGVVANLRGSGIDDWIYVLMRGCKCCVACPEFLVGDGPAEYVSRSGSRSSEALIPRLLLLLICMSRASVFFFRAPLFFFFPLRMWAFGACVSRKADAMSTRGSSGSPGSLPIELSIRSTDLPAERLYEEARRAASCRACF